MNNTQKKAQQMRHECERIVSRKRQMRSTRIKRFLKNDEYEHIKKKKTKKNLLLATVNEKHFFFIFIFLILILRLHNNCNEKQMI